MVWFVLIVKVVLADEPDKSHDSFFVLSLLSTIALDEFIWFICTGFVIVCFVPPVITTLVPKLNVTEPVDDDTVTLRAVPVALVTPLLFIVKV